MPDFSATLAGFTALSEHFVPFLLTGAAVAAGLLLIFSAITKLYRLGQAQHPGERPVGWGAVAGQLLVGGLLLRLAATMDDLSHLLFATGVQDIRGVLAYAPLQAQGGMWQQVLEVCLLWVVMLGWAGAFRGLLLWNRAVAGGEAGGTGGDCYWRGLWHLVGGAAAVNLTGLLQGFFGS